MKTLRNPFSWLVILCLGASLLWPVVQAADAGARSALRRRQQELELQLVAEKARLLREDPEAMALRERIDELYQQLDRLFADKPTVRQLGDELAKVGEALKASAPPGEGEGR